MDVKFSGDWNFSEFLVGLKFLKFLQANKWCSQGIEMLGSQNIEKHSMFPEKVEPVLTELEHFVASADTFNVSGSDDLYVLFQDSITPETKALVTQVERRAHHGA